MNPSSIIQQLPSAAMAWADASTMLAIVTGLVLVPLTVITFYLRALLMQQAAARTDFNGRFEHVEAAIRRLSRRVAEHERGLTSKEDWLRESMLARRNIERLTEAFARIEASLDVMLHRAPRATGAGRHDAGQEQD